jgi:cold shock protein
LLSFSPEEFVGLSVGEGRRLKPEGLGRERVASSERHAPIGGKATMIGDGQMTGKIRTLRVDKGFGFIKGETGQEYFFHQSAIYGEGIADLREGDGVEFEVADSPKGPRAENVKRTTT